MPLLGVLVTSKCHCELLQLQILMLSIPIPLLFSQCPHMMSEHMIKQSVLLLQAICHVHWKNKVFLL